MTNPPHRPILKSVHSLFHCFPDPNLFGATIGGPVDIPKLYYGKNRTFFLSNRIIVRTRIGITGRLPVFRWAAANRSASG